MFIHSWTSRYCKPWVILRSLITDQMKVRQNLVAKWSLQRIAIFLSLKQTPTEMYQHKMLSSQTTHTYSIVGVIRVGTWYVAIRLKFIYLNIIIFSHFFLFFKFCLYYFQIMKHILRSTMFQIKPTECKMLSSKITTLYFNMKWDPFLIIVLLNYLENRRYI